MTHKTITVTFTRETVAEATIEVPEGFDPISDTYEDLVHDWLDGHADELSFNHDGTDIQVWNIEPPKEEGAAPVLATVTMQRWVRDYANYVAEAEFDARAALDTIPLQELPEFADGFAEGACNFGDDVFHAAVRCHSVSDWDGPFEFDIADPDAYEAYYDARAAKAGLEPVER